jgi:hypothetical protein
MVPEGMVTGPGVFDIFPEGRAGGWLVLATAAIRPDIGAS